MTSIRGNHGKTKGYTAWNKGKTKENNESLKKAGETYKRRIKSGEITPSFLGKHHNEETRKKLSDIRKKWLLEHKDEHVWKRNTKFKSNPCENLKKYLLNIGINFVEEYEPFNENNYCLDIAWPDEKIAIEVNGNQHYNNDGTLKQYYQGRHDYFVNNGWTVFEIHYTKCYNVNIEDFKDILNLPIYDKNYVDIYFSNKQKREKQKEEKIKQYNEAKEIKIEYDKKICNCVKSILNEINLNAWDRSSKILSKIEPFIGIITRRKLQYVLKKYDIDLYNKIFNRKNIGSFGQKWISNPLTNESKRIHVEDLYKYEGWIFGKK